MTERGWKMTQGNLSKLIYAADQLLPNLPEALWAGMGVRVVETLRSLEKGYQTYWDAIVKLSDTAPSVEWTTLWNNTLREFDDLRFDVPEFRRTLDFKAADALQMSYNTLRSEEIGRASCREKAWRREGQAQCGRHKEQLKGSRGTYVKR